MTRTRQGNSLAELVQNIDGERCYLTKEVAAMVGCSADTIRRWRKSPHAISQRLVPSHQVKAGRLTISAYTLDDIEHLKTYAERIAYHKKEEA